MGMQKTNREILEKAIHKAIDGGWHVKWTAKDAFRVYDTYTQTNDGCKELIQKIEDFDFSEPRNFIFNHDFAKALWGEEEMTDRCKCGEIGEHKLHTFVIHGVVYTRRGWQHHLQQMVIADDPIAYIEEHLDDKEA